MSREAGILVEVGRGVGSRTVLFPLLYRRAPDPHAVSVDRHQLRAAWPASATWDLLAQPHQEVRLPLRLWDQIGEWPTTWVWTPYRRPGSRQWLWSKPFPRPKTAPKPIISVADRARQRARIASARQQATQSARGECRYCRAPVERGVRCAAHRQLAAIQQRARWHTQHPDAQIRDRTVRNRRRRPRPETPSMTRRRGVDTT